MKKEEERLEQLLQGKGVSELTGDEREFVLRALGSLEEYESMQKIESSLMNSKTDVKTSPLVLLSLRAQMKEKRLESSLLARIFDFKVPAYAAVFLVLICCFVTALLVAPTSKVQSRISVIQRIDTLVVTKIDTVIKERVVYRLSSNRSIATKQIVPTPLINETAAPKIIGVNMKEKEELNKLLVSGSE